MSEPTIYRYEVPVDDQWHRLTLTGMVLSCFAARRPEVVEFWAIANEQEPYEWEFRVFGTGQPLPPDRGSWFGTALAAGGRLVWHCFGRKISDGGGGEPGGD